MHIAKRLKSFATNSFTSSWPNGGRRVNRKFPHYEAVSSGHLQHLILSAGFELKKT